MSAFNEFLLRIADSGSSATLRDLWYCYRLFLNREPDQAGFDAYAAIVYRGLSVLELSRMFANSPEYASKSKADVDPATERVHLEQFDLYVFKADAVVGEQLLSQNVYEPHVTAAIEAVLRVGDCFVDVGANIGYFTCLAARLVGESGSVHSFEPLKSNVRLLLANRLINGFGNVNILPFAAAERTGFLTLMAMGSIASSKATDLEELIRINSLDFTYAQRIDEIVPVEPRVHAIKVDIDGYDYNAMLGAKRVLERWNPVVLAEYAPALLAEFSNIDPIEYLRYYRSVGYNTFEVLLKNGGKLSVGCDIERIAEMPQQLSATHVDIAIRRAA